MRDPDEHVDGLRIPGITTRHDLSKWPTFPGTVGSWDEEGFEEL